MTQSIKIYLRNQDLRYILPAAFSILLLASCELPDSHSAHLPVDFSPFMTRRAPENHRPIRAIRAGGEKLQKAVSPCLTGRADLDRISPLWALVKSHEYRFQSWTYEQRFSVLCRYSITS